MDSLQRMIGWNGGKPLDLGCLSIGASTRNGEVYTIDTNRLGVARNGSCIDVKFQFKNIGIRPNPSILQYMTLISWVRMAKSVGMKYIIITAKHHDGFALFKSDASTFNVVDHTVYGKDLLKPLAEACKKHGIKVGIYYSQAQDWSNAGGTVARKQMKEGWPNPDSAKIDAYTKIHNGHWDPIQSTRTFDEYINSIAVPQVREILTNYGEIAVLWWDTPVGMANSTAQKLHDLLTFQPHIITNHRLKRPNFPGDTKTPEQHVPTREELDGSYWEVCMTMNGSWGYKSWDHNWKSSKTLIRDLIDISSKGGNYLLNIGPKPDGTIPEESIALLHEIGKWMDVKLPYSNE